MPLNIPPGYGQASIILTGPLGTAPYVTTLAVSLAGAEGNYVGVANSIFSAYSGAFMSTTNDLLTLSKVSILVGDEDGNGSVDSTAAAVAGSNVGQMAPIAMAPILRKNTGELGRQGRGRMFLPGALGEADVDDNGQLAPAFRTGLGVAAQGFLDDIRNGDEASGFPPATPFLLHNSPTLTPYSILSLTAATTVGWIRKRLR